MQKINDPLPHFRPSVESAKWGRSQCLHRVATAERSFQTLSTKLRLLPHRPGTCHYTFMQATNSYDNGFWWHLFLVCSTTPQVLSPTIAAPPNVQPRRSSRLFTSASSTAKVLSFTHASLCIYICKKKREREGFINTLLMMELNRRIVRSWKWSSPPRFLTERPKRKRVREESPHLTWMRALRSSSWILPYRRARATSAHHSSKLLIYKRQLQVSENACF